MRLRKVTLRSSSGVNNRLFFFFLPLGVSGPLASYPAPFAPSMQRTGPSRAISAVQCVPGVD
jgi:hypothetical protein